MFQDRSAIIGSHSKAHLVKISPAELSYHSFLCTLDYVLQPGTSSSDLAQSVSDVYNENKIIFEGTISNKVFVVLISAFILGSSLSFFVVVVTRLLLRYGGMAEDHGVPQARQLPRAWTRGRRETESRQRVSGAKSP